MSAKRTFAKYMPVLFSAVSVAGLIATAVAAAKAAPKAEIALAEKENEKEAPLTTQEKVKAVLPLYLPAILTGTATTVCIVAGGTMSAKRFGSVCAGYTLLANRMARYRKEVRDVFGDEADRGIMEKVDAEICDAPPIYAPSGFGGAYFELPEDRERRLFFDGLGGIWFESTYEDVMNALYHIARNYVLGCAPVSAYNKILVIEHSYDR